MVKFWICFLSFWGAIYVLPGQPQSYIAEVKSFGAKEGLSHRDIYSIHQDHEGFMWIGTTYGLNHFDGKDFQWFLKSEDGLASNAVHAILEDAEGWLWLFDLGRGWFREDEVAHISLVNSETHEAQSLKEKFGDALPFHPNHLCGFHQTPNRTLYFTTPNELIRYHPAQGWAIMPLHGVDSVGLDFYSDDHHLWGFSEDHQLIELDTMGHVLRKVPLPYKKLFKGTVLSQDSQKKLTFSIIQFRDERRIDTVLGNPRVIDLTLRDELIERSKINRNSSFDTWDWLPQFAYQADPKYFWLKKIPELYVMDQNGNILIDFLEEYPQLAQAEPRVFYFGQDGLVWLGTPQGLFLLKLSPNPFTQYLYQDPTKTAPADLASCRGILQDGQYLYVNTFAGRKRIDLLTNEVVHLPLNMPTDTLPNPVWMLFSKAIMKDNEGNIWFSDQELIRRNPNTGKEDYFVGKEKADLIWSIYVDQEDKIWLGTESGLAYLDAKDMRMACYQPEQAFASLDSSSVRAIFDDGLGEMLLCTSKGLYRFHPEKGVLERLWKDEHVAYIHRDQSGIYWLATQNGLIRWDRKKEEHRRFTVVDGLSHNKLYCIYEDREEHLWMTSDYGIIRFDKKTFKSHSFLPKDGTTHAEFAWLSHHQAVDGRLYFGTYNGVTAFYPEEISPTALDFDLPLTITSFQQFDQKTNQVIDKTASLLQEGRISLEPGDRFFSVKAVLLDYLEADRIRYVYQVEGLDQEWLYTRENTFQFSGLPYGSFTLRIKGQGASGQYSSHELAIPIQVKRPLYMQVWFVVVMMLLFVVGLLLIFRWRTRLLRKRKVILEKMVADRTLQIEQDKRTIETQNQQLAAQSQELKLLDQAKSRFFANASHELRTPLTLILGPVQSIIKRQYLKPPFSEMLAGVQNNAQRLLKLVNQILDLSKLEADKLALQEEAICLVPFIKKIKSRFGSQATLQGIELALTLNIPDNISLFTDEEKLNQILSNLLSNALKFTPFGGRIELFVLLEGETIRFEIKDTGRGIHPSDIDYIFDRYFQTNRIDAAEEGGTGIGLALSQKLTEMLGGRLWVESEWGKGSHFFFTLPAKKVEGDIEKPTTVDSYLLPERAPLVGISATKTVLIVEDTVDVQAYIKFVIDAHYQVVTANNGQAALEMLADHDIDLIISDVMMPVMDGYQMLRILRQQAAYADIPVIMLTARAGKDERFMALRLGVDDYLTKPFLEDELLASVYHLLQHAEGRQEEANVSSAELQSVEAEASIEVGFANLEAKTAWLTDLEKIVFNGLQDPSLNTYSLAEQLSLSRSQLFRRLKTHTGLSPSAYLLEARLQRARELLESGTVSAVKEAAYAAGFSHLSKFSSHFKSRFGKSPSMYL